MAAGPPLVGKDWFPEEAQWGLPFLSFALLPLLVVNISVIYRQRESFEALLKTGERNLDWNYLTTNSYYSLQTPNELKKSHFITESLIGWLDPALLPPLFGRISAECCMFLLAATLFSSLIATHQKVIIWRLISFLRICINKIPCWAIILKD